MGDERVTLLNINKPNSRMHSTLQQCAVLYVKSLSRQSRNALPEACDDKQRWEWKKNKNTKTKRERNVCRMKIEKFSFFACKRQSGWAGTSTMKATDKMIELYLFIFMYLFVTTEWKQSAFYRIGPPVRVIRRHQLSHIHTHVRTTLSPLAQLFVSVECTFEFYLFLLFSKN